MHLSTFNYFKLKVIQFKGLNVKNITLFAFFQKKELTYIIFWYKSVQFSTYLRLNQFKNQAKIVLRLPSSWCFFCWICICFSACFCAYFRSCSGLLVSRWICFCIRFSSCFLLVLFCRSGLIHVLLKCFVRRKVITYFHI